MQDSVGLEITANSEGASSYDEALMSLLRFQPDITKKVRKITDSDPSAPMGYLFSAYLGLLSSERPDSLAGFDQLNSLEENVSSQNEREKMHALAVRQWLGGEMKASAKTLDEVLLTYPTDTLALYVGHQLDFFMGSSQHLNHRIASALPKLDTSHAHFGYVNSMWAFGLEESGNYTKAEELGRNSVDTNHDDVWGIHAVIHVLEMTGRIDDGLTYLNERRDDWLENNFLYVHNAWHNALFLLEREDFVGALTLYDSYIVTPLSANTAMEMLDASSLLWRLHLDGVNVGQRWNTLAEAWLTKDPEPWYAFNDMHAAMAFVASGRMVEANALVRRLETYVAATNTTVTNKEMTARVGLPIVRALVAHGQGNFAECAQILVPIRDNVAMFGGSHAQRDVVHRTLIDALQKAGNHSLATELLQRRLNDRPSSVWTTKRLAAA
ncbi:MAG: tetratricopeptide repeat protein [Acidimicrobiaceae bacterium]|nr:tetratricopeptide repeat protein [Acidimicrobiaceae bacterium]